MPAVLAFLGYIPWDCPDDPVGQLAHFKKVNGLSLQRLGVLIGRGPEQLEDWLSGRVKPCERNIVKIKEYLEALKAAFDLFYQFRILKYSRTA